MQLGIPAPPTAPPAKAQQLIPQELRTEGADEEELDRWRKGHPLKLRLAARLRTETTVTLDWITQRLKMGTRGHLAHLLCLPERARVQPPSATQPTLKI